MMNAQEPKSALDDAAWATATRLGDFSYASLAAEVGIPIERATRLTRNWVRCGAVDELGRVGNRLMFRVLAASMPVSPAPRHQSREGNMWRTMRHLGGEFTPTDIAMHATTTAVGVSVSDAQTYCQSLVRAGYLRVQRKAVPKRREARYRLIRNTGPMAPRDRRVRALWDPNLMAFVYLPEPTT